MINCHSLIIASFIARKVSINDVTQLCYTTRVCLRPLNLVWKSHHIFLHLELSLVPKVVFISRGGSTSLLCSPKTLSSTTVSLTLGASNFIGVNLELSSLVLRNKSHPSCRRLYRTFPTIQMHQLHG